MKRLRAGVSDRLLGRVLTAGARGRSYRVAPCAESSPPGPARCKDGCPADALVSRSEQYVENRAEDGASMKLELTAVFEKVPEGYVAFVEELPGANTQGATIEEARRNLEEAVQLVLEANRALAEEEIAGKDVLREPLRVSAA